MKTHFPLTYLLRALCSVSAGVIATNVIAGDFFEKGGVAIHGYDPVAYFQLGKAVQGFAEHRFEYKGSIFYFSSAELREAFVKAPAKYVPQYNGYCAFGMASGYKAATDPNAFTLVDGKLYLNYNTDIQKKWGGDIVEFVKKADAQWPTVERHTKVIE
jgi:YHS domain-containing protein